MKGPATCPASASNATKYGRSVLRTIRTCMTSARAGLDSCVCGRGRAICADSKLIPCWLVGDRSVVTAEKFISYIVSRLAHRVQLTTGSHRAHLTAVDNAFGSEI